MPSLLSRLFRFFRHDEQGENPIWIVSSAPFDSEFRIYRIMYEDVENNNLNTDTEIIIPIEKNWKQILEPIIQVLLKSQQQVEYVKEFRDACLDVMKNDPWIEEYLIDIFTVLTKTLQ